jgi:hypothetical protein
MLEIGADDQRRVTSIGLDQAEVSRSRRQIREIGED